MQSFMVRIKQLDTKTQVATCFILHNWLLPVMEQKRHLSTSVLETLLYVKLTSEA